MIHGEKKVTPAARAASSVKITAAEEARARRLAYGLPCGSAALEARRFRRAAGARFALSVELGFRARSSVIDALERRIGALETGLPDGGAA